MGIEDLAIRNSNKLSAGEHQNASPARSPVRDPRI